MNGISGKRCLLGWVNVAINEINYKYRCINNYTCCVTKYISKFNDYLCQFLTFNKIIKRKIYYCKISRRKRLGIPEIFLPKYFGFFRDDYIKTIFKNKMLIFVYLLFFVNNLH